MAPTAPPRAFTPIAGLRSLAWFAAAGAALSLTKAVTGIGLPCPWRQLTGTLCPLCGATTMGVHLLHGDLAAAWAANPLVLILLGLAGLAALAWVAELLGAPALRPPTRLQSGRLWWGLLAVLAVGFTVGRNLA